MRRRLERIYRGRIGLVPPPDFLLFLAARFSLSVLLASFFTPLRALSLFAIDLPPGRKRSKRTSRERRVHRAAGTKSVGNPIAEGHTLGQYDEVTGSSEEDRYGVNYKSYWVDEKQGKIFCLVDAPDAESAHTVHREAHGLVADEIYEVSEG